MASATPTAPREGQARRGSPSRATQAHGHLRTASSASGRARSAALSLAAVPRATSRARSTARSISWRRRGRPGRERRTVARPLAVAGLAPRATSSAWRGTTPAPSSASDRARSAAPA